MSITIQCPNAKCQQIVTAEESISGRNVKCKKCGTAFRATPTMDGTSSETSPKSNTHESGLFSTLPAEFGRYRVERLLGKGGMGAVYLAVDSQLNRKVALKIPFFDAREEPKRQERFLREARSAARLHHPNICTVFDVGEVSGRPFITMAFITGKPLEDLFDEDRLLPVSTVVGIIRKMALALQKAHDLSIVHRDLKPANVMITPDGEPVIMDFGLAKQIGQTDAAEAKLTLEGAILGTPKYMAPEQVNGDQKAIGPATDVYALGVMLFELLTGRAPYSGPLLSMLSQIASAPVPAARLLRAEVDEQLSSVCGKAMAKVPSDRFPSMTQLAEAMLPWTSVGGAMLTSESLPSGTQSWAKIGSDSGTLGTSAALSVNSSDGVIPASLFTTGTKSSGLKPGSRALDGRTRRSAASQTMETVVAEKVISKHRPTPSLLKRTQSLLRYVFADSSRIAILLSSIAGGFLLILVTTILIGQLTPPSKISVEVPVTVPQSAAKPPDTPTNDARTSKLLAFQRPEFSKWIKDVQTLSAQRQVEEVARKLMELNPSFDGVVTPKILGDKVIELTFVTDSVTDISPVRALEGLTTRR